jgi:hypothetical protein
MSALLQNAALQLNTQAIANHQVACHLMDLAFTEKMAKMDIAESFAAQGLMHASLPRDVAGAQTASRVPEGLKLGP